VNSVKAE
jgi:hypothetical protein